MTTPHERAAAAVNKILDQSVRDLRALESQAHESSTMVLARTAAEVVARYQAGL